jgi:hypothetical protein
MVYGLCSEKYELAKSIQIKKNSICIEGYSFVTFVLLLFFRFCFLSSLMINTNYSTDCFFLFFSTLIMFYFVTSILSLFRTDV